MEDIAGIIEAGSMSVNTETYWTIWFTAYYCPAHMVKFSRTNERELSFL